MSKDDEQLDDTSFVSPIKNYDVANDDFYSDNSQIHEQTSPMSPYKKEISVINDDQNSNGA